MRFDDASVDKRSDYDTTYSTGQSFSWDSSNSAYKIQRTSRGFGTVLVKDLIVPANVELSYDVKYSGSSTYNIQPRICLFNSDNEGVAFTWTYDTSSSFNVNNIAPSGDVSGIISDSYNAPLLNEWYHVELSFKDGNITVKLYHDNVLLKTGTATTDKFISDNNKAGVQLAYTLGAICYFKNLLIKPL